MTNREILNRVDYTMLLAVSTKAEIIKLCEKAILFNTASVCIPPSYVKFASEMFGEKLNICTVVGFPLGYSTKEVKVFEATQAILNGAREIDMVINLGDVKNKDFDKVFEEIVAIKSVVSENILKVIIETCYLNEEEKVKLCEIVTNANANYIKTSTGFGTLGATINDVELMDKHIKNGVLIKAAGGIRSKSEMEKFINSNSSRIGASNIDFLI